ncbi:DgyrCDS9423 [Dimorphilus gyrociliatus]|uniref:DgyrCDS9423 n=1 Tax=Dimorphilus gyrociliatus TaxID=2664684 RepID=A0A7I8VZ57_9ANNE|nr:DgyrCDS9423 [Dimorphilus gyrociliatus]
MGLLTDLFKQIGLTMNDGALNGCEKSDTNMSQTGNGLDDKSYDPLLTELSGEVIRERDKCSNGTIVLTSFRLLVQRKNLSDINVPVMTIDSVECRDLFTLTLLCKNAGVIRISFDTNEICTRWQNFISDAIKPPTNTRDLFAFKFKEAEDSSLANASNGSDESKGTQAEELDSELELYYADTERFKHEAKRLGFIGDENTDSPWAITDCNNEFRICESYPPQHIIPKEITDEQLKTVANFRSSNRFPSVVWRNKKNGAVILRSSQPQVGLLGWRCEEDENLLSAVCRACAQYNFDDENEDECSKRRQPNKDTNGNMQKMLILDLRSYASAIANRAKGGGSEYTEYYNCEIQYLNLVNIHEIRKSFCALRQNCCASSPDNTLWWSGVENSKWLHYISALLRSAIICVDAVKDGRPVLVHCSDGWDRTPQVTALAELMMDSHYRTIDGFRYLVEREWLDFGHKFGDRCGHGSNAINGNERSPAFLQWLDCVFQMVNQFPIAFEFNQSFLCKLVQHTYSTLFGTFLCNSVNERRCENIGQFTESIWRKLLNSTNYKVRNFLYSRTDKILKPSYHMRRLEVWKSVYLAYQDDEVTNDHIQDTVATTTVNIASEREAPVKILRTRSVDDLIVAESDHIQCSNNLLDERSRRLSDPNLHEAITKPTVHFDILTNSTSSNNSAPVVNVVEDTKILQNSTDTIKEENGHHLKERTVSTSTTDLARTDIVNAINSFKSLKTLQSSCPPTPGADSKSLSSTSSASSTGFDWDGLSTYMDPATRRLVNLCLEQKRQVEAFKQQVSGLTEQLVVKTLEIQRIESMVTAGEDSSSILMAEPNQVIKFYFSFG